MHDTVMGPLWGAGEGFPQLSLQCMLVQLQQTARSPVSDRRMRTAVEAFRDETRPERGSEVA
jgi:hypothetical protein